MFEYYGKFVEDNKVEIKCMESGMPTFYCIKRTGETRKQLYARVEDLLESLNSVELKNARLESN